MTYLEEIAAFRAKAIIVSPGFLDVNGNMIKIGDLVHYTKDHRSEDLVSAWHPDRWGVVVGLTRYESLFHEDVDLHRSVHSVQVVAPHVVTSRKEATYGQQDEWFTEPQKLEIVK